MIVARLRRNRAVDQPARRLEVEHRHHRLKQRGVHPLSPAGPLALEQRRRVDLSEMEPRVESGDGNAHAHRPLARQARDGHEPAHALGDLVVAGPVAIRPRLAEAGDGPVDQARVDPRERFVVDPEPCLDVGPEVLHEHVGAGDEALEDLDPARVLEVERHRALVPLEIQEVEAERRGVALDLLARLHLDDVGPHVGELAHGGRARAGAREVDNRDVLERQLHQRVPAGRIAEPVCEAGLRPGRPFREPRVELAPAHRVLVHELHARRAPGVDVGGLGHAVFLEAPRRQLRVRVELRALARHAAVARARDDQRKRALRVAQAEVERRVAAHRKAAHMGLRDLQGVQETANVVRGLVLRVGLRILRHVRRRVATRVEGDRAIAAREEAPLEVPAPVVAGELVDEDERQALARFLVVEIDAVRTRRRHQSDQGKFALRISNFFFPPGSSAVAVSPTFLPISVRARGARIEILPRAGSASSEPTIWYRYSFPLSSSRSTVEPKVTRSPPIWGSITSALPTLASSAAIRPSMKPSFSRAAWYSAFSDRSPCARASAIALEVAGRSTRLSRSSSSLSFSWPARVIGVRWTDMASTLARGPDGLLSPVVTWACSGPRPSRSRAPR